QDGCEVPPRARLGRLDRCRGRAFALIPSSMNPTLGFSPLQAHIARSRPDPANGAGVTERALPGRATGAGVTERTLPGRRLGAGVTERAPRGANGRSPVLPDFAMVAAEL